MFPKISIVTPSFNQGSYLEHTIKSVLNQEYPNLEYILMDGGSSDNSNDIITKYSSKFKFHVSLRDNGMYDAIQKGFEHSSGEIMAWINSDDIYVHNSFFVVAEIFSKYPQINWLTGSSSFLDEHNRIIKFETSPKWSKYKYYLHEYKWIQQESVFWRRPLWEKAGGKINTTLQVAGDFELWLRYFRHEKLYSVNAPLGCFRLRSKGQQSMELMDLYLDEVNKILNNEPISHKDVKTLRQIRLLRKCIKIPILRSIPSLLNKCNSLFQYPEELVFDRKSQSFLLKPT
jgi:glycosyltransferase involved in cell wall biosynthesis